MSYTPPVDLQCGTMSVYHSIMNYIVQRHKDTDNGLNWANPYTCNLLEYSANTAFPLAPGPPKFTKTVPLEGFLAAANFTTSRSYSLSDRGFV